jgi:hypothetical protein
VNWWLSDGNKSTGPHGEAALVAGVKKGRISPLSYVCPVGGQEWKMVCEWPAFIPACAAVGTVAYSSPGVTTQAAVRGAKGTQKAWSGLALTSLIMAVAAFFSHFVSLIIAAVGVSSGKAGEDPILMIAGLMVFANLAVNLFGVVFGVVGLTQSTGHKWMAIVGVVGNIFEMLTIVALVALGTAVG